MGHQALANDHKWPNDDPPLGYERCENGKLAIMEREADLVRDIFKMYLEEKSMPQVARILNEDGVQTRDGNEWIPRAVGDILRNELYFGRYQIAGTDDILEEYKILEESLFERARQVRHRFQKEENSKREEMDRERKQEAVDGVINEFIDHLDS
jgi:site-specific DNA recombinase